MSDPIDVDSLTDEQLLELANNPELSAFKPAGEEPAKEQPRGPDGKFLAQPDPTPDPVVDDAPVVYQRIIDLNDGSGAQVFQSDTMEGLLDKLAEAQTHATRKIREQNRQLKEREVAPAPKPTELTPDQKYVLAQRLMNEPDVVIQERVQEHLQKDPVYQNMRQQQKIAAATQVFEQWQTTQPEFHFTPSNAKKMGNMLQILHGGVATPENIEACYQQLKTDGLLQVKPVDPPPTTVTTVVQPQAIRRSSGLSARASALPPVAPAASAIDPYKIPLEELAELANRQAREEREARR